MTRWNHFAGTAIVPTLARLVLAMAFITIGLHKIAHDVDFSAEEAATLHDEFNIDLQQAPVETVSLLRWQEDPAAQTNEESKPPQDESSPPDASESDIEQAAEAMQQTAADAADKAGEAVDTAQDESDAGELIEVPRGDQGTVYRGKARLKLVLLLHDSGMPNPVLLSWLAALTEFAGGILILIGLFSRVWGLGLAITMGMAFYLTTMQPYFTTGPFEVAAQPNLRLYNTVFAQLGLGTLALLIFLAGPGPLSLDRLIFRPRQPDAMEEQRPKRIERPREDAAS